MQLRGKSGSGGGGGSVDDNVRWWDAADADGEADGANE